MNIVQTITIALLIVLVIFTENLVRRVAALERERETCTVPALIPATYKDVEPSTEYMAGL